MKKNKLTGSELKANSAAGRRAWAIRRWWLHAVWWHFRETCKSARALVVELPRFLRDAHDHRRFQEPSLPHLVFGKKQWTSRYRINFPTLHVTVQDGMGEHYGYPRHSCYLILWWGRYGYAFGVYFSQPSDPPTR
jgi:hypothetical protein